MAAAQAVVRPVKTVRPKMRTGTKELRASAPKDRAVVANERKIATSVKKDAFPFVSFSVM
jgi:hypothetical protein